jgi:hypothetical protein
MSIAALYGVETRHLIWRCIVVTEIFGISVGQNRSHPSPAFGDDSRTIDCYRWDNVAVGALLRGFAKDNLYRVRLMEKSSYKDVPRRRLV